MKKHIIQLVWIFLGVLLLDIGYFFFFLPTNLVIGGTMGIAIIVEKYLPFSTSIFLYIIDGILLIIGLIFLGKEFFTKTIFATLVSPSIILIFETFCDSNFFFKDSMQSSYFVAMVAGGLLTALGLGLCFRNNGTTGGMDVIQKILSKYLHIPYSITMYLSDVIIIFIGGLFISSKVYDIEMVIYGVICVIGIGFVVDFVALNAKSRRTAYIITTKPLEMKNMIYEKIDRGLTICDVKGGYTNESKTMIICTMDKSEAYRISEYVKQVDEEAFTFITQTKEVAGNYEGINSFKRPSIKR